MPALFEVLDSSQSVEHALQASTLGHDTRHLINFFLILLFIYRTDTDREERKQPQYGKLVQPTGQNSEAKMESTVRHIYQQFKSLQLYQI